MSTLKKLQHDFVAMLQGQNTTFTEHIAKQNGLSTAQRGEIYQNAYQIRLKKVLEQDHEMLGLYLGDELFDHMVEEYLSQYPSRSASLREFGDRIPQLLKSSPRFKEHGILAEIALFERLLLHAFDAADSPTLQLAHLQSIEQSAWPNIVFQLHDSVQLLSCEYSAVESWQALKNGGSPPSPNQGGLRHWIVARAPDKRTGFYPLSQCHFQCLTSIEKGLPFGFVCEAAANVVGDQQQGTLQVMQLLQQGIELGWFIASPQGSQ
ncbi:HvfC/BufC N-terminal domain-containing protein [Pseudoalteromonas luteoviolacea]|uniref:HvfC/BufC N-terminal domain-containing protein n=1 Tax=Pseudoalteromonas luteoviolacea TaxID=43657 RepID=UPI001B37034F|nr:DNA-binding domain-containing protein [Pseudoalteromonas luteoviolacea]MBQ4837892.1 putative DNA-binding domain-containing protein [Pseudoalteromonas luteoviolacea]